MEFDLTPEITDEIIFSMEDQTGHFLFDSAECRCVNAGDLDDTVELDDSADDERYYDIPEWDSISGFRMMDRFVSQLRNPVVREELRSALASGRGVFRQFKAILKIHTEVERLWYQFKDREMKNIVLEWYNCLRDFWGLSRIGAEGEEMTDIVSHDFLFRPYLPSDETTLAVLMESVEQEILHDLSPGLSEALSVLWDRIREDGDNPETGTILVAESPDGAVVGCAVSSPLPSGSLQAAQLTFVGVYPEFRGLGIGSELLSRTVDFWARKNFRWLVFTCPVVPHEFFPVLQRSGFTEGGHVSVLDLPVL